MQIHNGLIKQFLDHVHSVPQQQAIITSDISLTYAQLYEEVQHWKAFFEQYGITRAIICVNRTPRLIAILLALQWLKITYIPVTLSIPTARLLAILQDSEADAFIYDTPENPEYAKFPCLRINLNDPAPPANNHKIVQHAQNNPIYIIYTSGSTGNPKGVSISVKAFNNFLESMSHYFLNRTHELVLAITTITFDIAVLELYLPLWQQKTLFLTNQEQHQDPFAISQILQNYPITLLQATPVIWNMLNSTEWQKKADLIALTGGERLTETLAQNLLPKVDQLWNMYGPTEATVWCSLKQILPDSLITVGKPIEHMEMAVMNDAYEVLPPNQKGELFIGGVGLADGYVNNPALTQKSFVELNSKRFYRVGDIAYTTAEGEFVICGRTDNQIKLHGYRIELEDIESHIQALPNIKTCAASVYHEQLIAYVAVIDQALFSEQKIIHHLAEALPTYMIPKRILLLEELPLTTSGKINRKALPEPDYIHPVDQAKYSNIQQTLINIWKKELNISQISIHDDFFALGGDSLLAIRILAAIQEQLEKKIPLNVFYHARNVKELAEVIEEMQNIHVDTGAPKKTSKIQTRWHMLNDFQLLLWISTLFEPKVKKMNISARRRIQGPINKEALDLALQAVFKQHEIFSYQIQTFFPLQKQSSVEAPQWIEEDLTEQALETLEAYLAKSYNKLHHHYPWPKGMPLIQAKIIYLPDDVIEFQVSMPHLISDENSMVVFFNDLTNAYLHHTQRLPLNFEDNFKRFKNFTLHANDKMLQQIKPDTEFWHRYLSDTKLYCFDNALILQHPYKNQLTYSSYLEIPETLIELLQPFCVRHRLTISDIFCANIGLTLKNISPEATLNKILINMAKSARTDSHFDRVMGCFLSLQQIKLDLRIDSELIGFAKQVQEANFETAEYQSASSLIKLASVIRNAVVTKYQYKAFNKILKVLIKLFKLNLAPEIADACAALAIYKPKNEYLINLNIWQSFFRAKQHQPTVLNHKCQTIPRHYYDLSGFNNVLDLTFLRDDNSNKPYLVISANLDPAFRVKLGRTFLSLLEQHLVTVVSELV